MAWTTPPTFVDGQILTAAQMNQYVTDNENYLYGISQGVTFSGTRVTRAASTSISDSTDSAITFTAEAYDYGSWYTSGTNVVVPSGAIPSGFTTIALLCVGSTTWTANGTGRRYTYVKQNGTVIAGASVTGDAGEDMFQVTPPGFIVVSAGDIITLSLKQTSGSGLAAYNSQLIVVRFAPVA